MMVSILDAGLLSVEEIGCLDPVATRFWFHHARDKETGRLKVEEGVLPAEKPAERAERLQRALGAKLAAQGLTREQITQRFVDMLRGMVGGGRSGVKTRPRKKPGK